MNILRLAALPLLFLPAPLIAHDFWIQPARFQVRAGATVPILFQVGHGAARDRWQNNDRIVLIADFFGGTRRDRKADLRQGQSADMMIRYAVPGFHILGMQTNYAYSELPAIRFNDYASAEGLTAITTSRRIGGKAGSVGRERYSRRAKALVQVGTPVARKGDYVTRPIGLKLEIVPERNPLTLGARRALPLYVLYNGRRLAGASVKLTNLGNDEKPVATRVTDPQGRATFVIPRNGEWLLNVVWSETIKGDAKADFETTFSSFTFGLTGPVAGR